MDGSDSPEGLHIEIKSVEEGIVSLPLPDISTLTTSQLSITRRIRERSVAALEEADYPVDQIDPYRENEKLALLITDSTIPTDRNVYDQPPYREILEEAMAVTGRDRDSIAELLSLAGSSYGLHISEKDVDPEKVVANVESKVKDPKVQERLQIKASHRMRMSDKQEAVRIIAQGLALFPQSGLYLRKLGFNGVTPKTPGAYLLNGSPNPRYKSLHIPLDSYAYLLTKYLDRRFQVPIELLPQ